VALLSYAMLLHFMFFEESVYCFSTKCKHTNSTNHLVAYILRVYITVNLFPIKRLKKQQHQNIQQTIETLWVV